MKTSVALCTYNGEKFIRQQIDSILDQTKKVDEIVVCDDGSTDSTVSILNFYKEKHPELFKIFINDENLRSVKNFEKAISLCENDIIFLCDQDDLWLSSKVDVYCNFFQENLHISVICSGGFAIDEKNNLLDKLSIWDAPELLKMNGRELNFFEITAFLRNLATGATMAFRKEFKAQIIPFPVLDNFHHDEWIALVGTYQQKFYMLPGKYIQYRIHGNQQVGGIFMNPTNTSQKYLLDYFSFNSFNGNFRTYRKILRSLKNAVHKFSVMQKNSDFQREMIQHLQVLASQKYEAKKIKVKKEFPIQSIFIK